MCPRLSRLAAAVMGGDSHFSAASVGATGGLAVDSLAGNARKQSWTREILSR
jgi:hypothetical protein